MKRTVIIGVYIGAPEFGKLPFKYAVVPEAYTAGAYANLLLVMHTVTVETAVNNQDPSLHRVRAV